MADSRVMPIVTGLATGLVFIITFSVLFQPSSASVNESVIIIPRGASLESSGVTFEPQVTVVTIGYNNTIRWVNNDDVPHFIEADNMTDPDFYDATAKDANFIQPGQGFTFTFDKPGEFHYHGKPWLSGKVIVLPPIP